MGEEADFLINQEILFDLFGPDKPEALTWIDKSGKFWNIRDMDTNHIVACVKMLENRIIEAQLYIELFHDEINRREDNLGKIYE